MKIAIVTDSTAYLTPEERREWNIHVLPLSVIFGQESYREEQDLTTADFYEKVKKSEVFPTSSQPAVGETIELFRELSHHYDAIIPILLSSGISGTYQTVVTVAEELQDEVLIYPIDSGISCAPQARAVRLAAMMAKDEQYTAKEIVACVQQLVDRTTAYFIVDDLNNLQRGGRLSAGAALGGSMLKIKPILTFEDKQSVAMDTETIVERSAYNFAVVFVKSSNTDDYKDPPKMYTAKNNGDVIDYSTYHGDGTDLPDVRTAKTLFYDRDDHGNPPDMSTIKAEISPSTIVTRLIFNQNELLPLYVNDLVDIWYEGKLYSGYIADRVKTEFNDRLIFVESGDKPNVI